MYDVNGTAFYSGEDDMNVTVIEDALYEFLSTKLINGTALVSDTLVVYISKSEQQRASNKSNTTYWALPLSGMVIIATVFYFIQQKRTNVQRVVSPTKHRLRNRRDHYHNEGLPNLTRPPLVKDSYKVSNVRSHNANKKSSFPVVLQSDDLNTSTDILLPIKSLSSPVTKRSNKKKPRTRENDWYQDLDNQIIPSELYGDTVDF